MEFKSINPYNGKTVGQYTAHTEEETKAILNKASEAFKSWRLV
ncbi:MAG: succinate-semialdehyde dehydrogenase/glutarate-semialdehyde dehydrogenase, partial [Saprospiraceae bacterium]